MLKVDASSKKINDFLERGVREITTRESILKKLSSGKVLRVKHGVDPSGADLHLGHASVYLKLRDLQEMGHKIVFLIGGFTGRFGDPTGKMETRTLRTKKEAEETAKDYIKQVSKILDVKKLEIRSNSEWYDGLSAEELLKIIAHFTVDQVLERDMFQERKKRNKPIQLHEIIYPILQGYDSVMLKSDLTVIGTDQIFNENFGRELQKKYNQEPQDIVAVSILRGLDGKNKMGKSLNNYIALSENAGEQFGKVMSLPDSLIIDYFILATRIGLDEIGKMEIALKDGLANPRDLKIKLAKEIVSFYHSPEAASEAGENFARTFSQKMAPHNFIRVATSEPEKKLLDMVFESGFKSGLIKSKSEARRLIDGGAVDVDGETKKDIDEIISVKKSIMLKIGKHRFIEISLEK